MAVGMGMAVVKTPKNAFLLLESFLAILLKRGYLDIMPCQHKKNMLGNEKEKPMRYVYIMYISSIYTYMIIFLVCMVLAL